MIGPDRSNYRLKMCYIRLVPGTVLRSYQIGHSSYRSFCIDGSYDKYDPYMISTCNRYPTDHLPLTPHVYQYSTDCSHTTRPLIGAPLIISKPWFTADPYKPSLTEIDRFDVYTVPLATVNVHSLSQVLVGVSHDTRNIW